MREPTVPHMDDDLQKSLGTLRKDLSFGDERNALSEKFGSTADAIEKTAAALQKMERKIDRQEERFAKSLDTFHGFRLVTFGGAAAMAIALSFLTWKVSHDSAVNAEGLRNAYAAIATKSAENQAMISVDSEKARSMIRQVSEAQVQQGQATAKLIDSLMISQQEQNKQTQTILTNLQEGQIEDRERYQKAIQQTNQQLEDRQKAYEALRVQLDQRQKEYEALLAEYSREKSKPPVVIRTGGGGSGGVPGILRKAIMPF